MPKTALLLTPVLLGSVGWSCVLDNTPDLPLTADTEVRVSLSVPAEVALSGVEVALTPAQNCEGSDPGDGGPWTAEIADFILPSGAPADEGPGEYTYVLAEASFVDLPAGCYDIAARPDPSEDPQGLTCVVPEVTIALALGDSKIVDLPVTCSEPPRELDPIEAELVNTAPSIVDIYLSEELSACDPVEVCATVSDPDFDMLEFEWSHPAELLPSGTGHWPVITSHHLNVDRSVTQCIAVQAELAGTHELNLEVYDLIDRSPVGIGLERIEDVFGAPSRASQVIGVDASVGCGNASRSAVIAMTLGNEIGMDPDDVLTLVSNTLAWTLGEEQALASAAQILVVLDDNHRGEDAEDGEFVVSTMEKLGYLPDYMVEPAAGLSFDELSQFELVWFVNPGHELDQLSSFQALNRYRQAGGSLILQGDDITRFRGEPAFMSPMTYLTWHGNGTVACGAWIDNNQGESYTVRFDEAIDPIVGPHPMIVGLEQLSFEYGNDIDLTRPANHGEQVLAWASYETRSCVLRTPAIVALDPELLLPF